MNKQFYFLSPVEVVKVTAQNLEEVAEWCGGTVEETESRRVQGRMDKYVWVPTPKDNSVSWAFPGMFVTKRLVITMKGELKATWAVFRRDYFEKNYFDSVKAATDATWEREFDEANKGRQEVTVNVSVGDAMRDAHVLDKIKKIAANSGATLNINVTQDQPFSHGKQVDSNGQEVHASQDTPKFVGTGEEVLEIKHNHLLAEGCDVSGCEADRYIDGLHIFTDQSVLARPTEDEPLPLPTS